MNPTLSLQNDTSTSHTNSGISRDSTHDISASMFFNLARNGHYDGQRKINLLDIGDYWTLSFDIQLQPEYYRDIVVKLYREFDETAKFVLDADSQISTTNGEQNLIKRTLGTIFPKRVGDESNLSPELILHEIRDIIQFYNIAKKYNKISELIAVSKTEPPGPWNLPSDMLNVCDNGIELQTPDTWTAQFGEKSLATWEKNVTPINDDSKNVISYGLWTQLSHEVHIIFNTIFNISLIYENVVPCQKNDCETICKNYPEFVLVNKIKNYGDKTSSEMLARLFHKKTFESSDQVSKKIDSFINLFDIDQNPEVLPVRDIDKVRDCLDTYFIVSDDPSSRMKASHLFEAILFLTNGSEDLKKKLPGLLLESGLNKRRFKDGQYYWGIKRRDQLTESNENVVSQYNLRVVERAKTF